jgi:hypothetical protein
MFVDDVAGYRTGKESKIFLKTTLNTRQLAGRDESDRP